MEKSIKRIVEHSQTSEKSIEAYLVSAVEKCGGVCLKYYNAMRAGYPDRVCLFPRGVTVWVELKGADGRLRPLQRERIAELRALGHRVAVCRTRAEVYVLVSRTMAGVEAAGDGI